MAGIGVVLLVPLFASFGVSAYGVKIYNGLVQVKHQVERAGSNLDVFSSNGTASCPSCSVRSRAA